MIKRMRYSNLLSIALLLLGFGWVFLFDRSLDIYEIGIYIILILFASNVFIAFQLKKKQKNGEIQIFYNRNKEPLFARWTVLVLAIVILFFVLWDATDLAGWFWLTLLITKGIEHLIHNTEWNLLIENNIVYERGFWMKPIQISELMQIHINDQAELELTTGKGMTLFKLESGISANVRDKIIEIQNTINA